MTIQLKGQRLSGRVWLFDQELHPKAYFQVKKHAPSFAWGYNGSGPAQLSLAICVELFGPERALVLYQDFKYWYIGALPQCDFEMDIQIQPELFRVNC